MALAAEPRLARVPHFCTTIDEAVHRDCERVRPTARSILSLLRCAQRAAGELRLERLSRSTPPSSLGALEFFHDVCGLQRQTAALVGLWQIAKNAVVDAPAPAGVLAGGAAAACFASDAGPPARADGPAVGYPDGWSAYAWKGVLVPRWIIERPELITVRTIGAAMDPQVRRCMIEILTPERFIAQGGAYRVAQDETGVLWRQRWRWEAWAAVEVVNGTPEPDGTRKRYFLQVPANMRTAREAVAWTYGLPEARYRPVVRT